MAISETNNTCVNISQPWFCLCKSPTTLCLSSLYFRKYFTLSRFRQNEWINCYQLMVACICRLNFFFCHNIIFSKNIVLCTMSATQYCLKK